MNDLVKLCEICSIHWIYKWPTMLPKLRFFHAFLMGAHCSLQRCLPMPYLNLFDRVQSILVGRMGIQSTFMRIFDGFKPKQRGPIFYHISSSCFWVPFAYGHFRHRSTHMYPSNKHESLNCGFWWVLAKQGLIDRLLEQFKHVDNTNQWRTNV